MTLALRILALLFEFGAIGLFILEIIKERKDKPVLDFKLMVRDGIILLLWASNTCLAILLMR